MEIKNDTSNDATVIVSGGGSGIKKPTEDVLSVPAGGSISHTPRPPGPWQVAFCIGDQQTRKMVHCATDNVTLRRAGNNGYRVVS